jgi:beta-glucosidase
VDGSAVTVEVTNTGGRTSREVVQVYLEPADADQPCGSSAGPRSPPAGRDAPVRVETDARLWRRWTDAGWDAFRRRPPPVARGLGDIRASLNL